MNNPNTLDMLSEAEKNALYEFAIEMSSAFAEMVSKVKKFINSEQGKRMIEIAKIMNEEHNNGKDK